MCGNAEYVSLADAARRLSTTESRILMMLKAQQLSGREQDGSWVVERVGLEACAPPTPASLTGKGCGGCSGCRPEADGPG